MVTHEHDGTFGRLLGSGRGDHEVIGKALARDAGHAEPEPGRALREQRGHRIAARLVGRVRAQNDEVADGLEHGVRAARRGPRERLHRVVERVAHGAGLTVTSMGGFSTAPGPNGNGMEVLSIQLGRRLL